MPLIGEDHGLGIASPCLRRDGPLLAYRKPYARFYEFDDPGPDVATA